MRIISVEEHFETKEYLSYLRLRQDCPKHVVIQADNPRIEEIWYTPACKYTLNNSKLLEKLTDLGDGRLSEMNKFGIDMQVLSLSTTGVDSFDTDDGIKWARQTNDALAKSINEHPDRLAGLAALPLQEPGAAVIELERAVTQLGLKGALINSHVQGEYLDNKKFWGIFEKAEKLGVPIYIHPKEPSPQMIGPYLAYPALFSAIWGYAAEVSLHVMLLMCSGVFDEFPKLKIIIGHMGEGLPFWLWRLDNHWSRLPMGQTLKKKPSEYLKTNFFVTTSGMFSQQALLCTYLTLGADNILFAVDYPHDSNEEAVKFINAAPISNGDKEKICHTNAEMLFNL